MDTLGYILVLGISLFKFVELFAWLSATRPRTKDILAGISPSSRHFGVWSNVEMLLAIPWTACGLIILHESPADEAFGFILTIGGLCWIATAVMAIRWLQTSIRLSTTS